MKNLSACLAVFLFAADVFAQPAAPAAAPGTNAPRRRAGGRGPGNSNDVFYSLGPDSKPRDGMPKGKFAGPKSIPSEIFPGTTHTYDVYVPAQYDPPTDKYARFTVEELMPALKKDYNISPDPELHGTMGASSGGIAAFTTAWFRPNAFRKVISIVGSFTDIRGGYIFPEQVAASEKKPIRIFLQDGRNDNRAPGRPNNDWFLQNVRLKDALTQKGYDVNYSWGMNNHGQKMGGAIFPEMMRWLWRDQPVSTDPNDTVERSFRPPALPAGTAVKPVN